MKTVVLVFALILFSWQTNAQAISNVAKANGESIVKVDPKNPWTPTNTVVSPNEYFEIFVHGVGASSTGDIGSWTGPMGNGYIGDSRFPLPGYSTYSVIGRVGRNGTPFFVGEHFKGQYTGAASDTLYLGYNDIIDFSDNDGLFLAYILKITPSKYWVVNIDPQADWSSTGINIAEGDTLDIRVMGVGTSATTDSNAWVGNWGNGFPTDSRFPLSGVSQFTVLGKVGASGTPFLVGGRVTFTYTGSAGTLYLGFNDILNFADNGGSYVAFVAKLNGASNPGTPDLVAYYPFNGNANDESGYGNNGTVYGAQLTADRFGNANSAYYFNGTSDSIRVLNSPSLNFQYGSFCAWVYYEGGTYNPRVLSKGPQYDIFIEQSVGGGLGANFNTQTDRSNYVVPSNQWHFLCIVKDTAEVRFYDNGTLVDSLPHTGAIAATGTNLLIGASPSSAAPTDRFKGIIDDIRIYDRALSQGEITALVTSISDAGSNWQAPVSFSLEQNYPNPFNPTTVIRYALPQRAQVTLDVFNNLGQKIATLVDGEVSAGTHEARFEAKGLASGVYFYRIQAGEFIQTKSLLLLK